MEEWQTSPLGEAPETSTQMNEARWRFSHNMEQQGVALEVVLEVVDEERALRAVTAPSS